MSDTDAPSWAPLLTGDDAAAATATLDHIRRDLAALDPATVTADLAGGAAGVALFFAYAAHGGDETSSAEAERWLEASIQGLSSQGSGPALIGGYTGVGWAASHLCDEATATEICAVVDEALLGVLATPPADRDYDFIAGLAGYGLYALAAPTTDSAVRVRTTILDQLEATARVDAGGRAWYTPPSLLPAWQLEHCPDGYWNLGLGHGVPGVIGLLARYVAAGVEVARAGALLDDAVSWLLSVAEPREHGRFYAWRGRGGSDALSRLAWCYGDPGACIALLAAARATGRDDWERDARDLATKMARRPPETAGIADGGLCHGAGGLGHILHRLGTATGDGEVLEAARFWFRQLERMHRPDGELGGFLTYRGPDEEPRPEAGFLTGVAGVGLTLLAATTDVAPDWDQVLLLDVT
jgi:lantibiotic biosynthesis protein